jgi:hypothetical protein
MSWQSLVDLIASRFGSDRDGRHYVIGVTIYDVAGNVAQIDLSVVVPHDQR